MSGCEILQFRIKFAKQSQRLVALFSALIELRVAERSRNRGVEDQHRLFHWYLLHVESVAPDVKRVTLSAKRGRKLIHHSDSYADELILDIP